MSLPFIKKMSFGASIGYTPPCPEKTARKSSKGYAGDVIYRQWSTRQAMAKAIRKEQENPPSSDNWVPCVKLTDTEGFY